MDCIVVSEERLASLSQFLNEKVNAESTNEYYEDALVRVHADGKTGDKAIADHYHEAATQRDNFYTANLDATEDYYKKKETAMEDRLKHAIEQSETQCEKRNRDAEEHANENKEKLERMTENNKAFKEKMDEEAQTYNAVVKRISDQVHDKMEEVKGYIDKAATGRIPDEWLNGQWAYTNSSMDSAPATPASPGGTASSQGGAAGSTPGLGAGGAAGGPAAGLTGTTPGAGQTSVLNTSVGSSAFDFDPVAEGEEGSAEGSRPGTAATGGSEGRPASGDAGGDAIMTMLFDRADKDKDSKLNHEEFEKLEIELGRVPIGQEAWGTICKDVGRDPQIGIDRRDFLGIFPARIQDELGGPLGADALTQELRTMATSLNLQTEHLFAATAAIMENTSPDQAMEDDGAGVGLRPKTG